MVNPRGEEGIVIFAASAEIKENMGRPEII
jgi:hypothetical protein